jgi:hypothetical protein
LAKSLAYPSGEEVGNFLFQMISYLSSLHVEEGGRGSAPCAPHPPSPPFFPAGPMDISFKDDVTVILLLRVSFMYFRVDGLRCIRIQEIKFGKETLAY